MKFKIPIIITSLLFFVSCNRSIYGIYNTGYSTDKSALLQIKIDSNHTVEKNEIHTIRIDSKGSWKQEGEKIICYFYQTETGFPADTMNLKIIGNRMYIVEKGSFKNKSFYLKKIK
ncbi:hypothetical protein FFWV33_11775 [Flavobacterium faecale]|uniref:Lipoprotein n=1 Tax=Flavobacterium faecale TaxID=1355330 RepID=A0A2S1LEQ0_9FLAO|nr:hypothetical protein [Flavobacterium faecale]AWG22141.1 hypothetical protein FFWV33_11775 [Flavobacterium faecale]